MYSFKGHIHYIILNVNVKYDIDIWQISAECYKIQMTNIKLFYLLKFSK